MFVGLQLALIIRPIHGTAASHPARALQEDPSPDNESSTRDILYRLRGHALTPHSYICQPHVSRGIALFVWHLCVEWIHRTEGGSWWLLASFLTPHNSLGAYMLCVWLRNLQTTVFLKIWRKPMHIQLLCIYSPSSDLLLNAWTWSHPFPLPLDAIHLKTLVAEDGRQLANSCQAVTKKLYPVLHL